MDMSHLSDNQKIVFDQFKAAVADCQRADQSDNYLLKWLIAREFNTTKAEIMFRRSMEWRQMNMIDNLIDNWKPPEVLKKYYSFGTTGSDKMGCQIWISAFGRTDVKGLLRSVSKRDYVRYIIYLSEQSHVLAKQLGKYGHLQTLIMDMEHLSVSQISNKPFMDVGMEIIRLTEANYPEGIRRVFLINVPHIFSLVFSMIKPFLNQATLDKIRVFGFDSAEWKAALLEEIEADQLPAIYGGKMTDPDGNGKCLTKINWGGEVPKSYYITNSKPVPKQNMESVNISAGGKKLIAFDITRINSILKWEFLTEEADISFGIYCPPTTNNDEELEVVPRTRVDSHLLMEEGEIYCSHLGTYVMEFDNSFSYLRSKKLWYSIGVHPPSTALNTTDGKNHMTKLL